MSIFSAMYSSWGLLSKFFQNLRTAKKKANYRGLKESAIFCYVLIFLFFSWKSLWSIFDPKIHMGKNTYFSMRFILMMYENTAKSLSFVKTKKKSYYLVFTTSYQKLVFLHAELVFETQQLLVQNSIFETFWWFSDTVSLM